MPTREELKILQSLPLDVKIIKSQQRIKEWVDFYGEDGVYVSFSGGKDSTVLLDIVRKIYPKIEAVFVNTGLEYPEITDFVSQYNNVRIIYPSKNFKRVIVEHGYPVISKEVSNVIDGARKGSISRLKRLDGVLKNGNKLSDFNIPQWKFLLKAPFKISDYCCNEMKKKPFHKVQKKPIIGQLAEESKKRLDGWCESGCNAFNGDTPQSNPLAFWTNNDILTYIHTYNLKIASVYGDIVPDDKGQIPGQTNLHDITGNYQNCTFKTTECKRTGCMFCLFGAHLEKGEGRLERMKHTHPKRYEYVIGGGEFNDQGLWIPNSKGLGFKFVIDWLNENGNLNIKY